MIDDIYDLNRWLMIIDDMDDIDDMIIECSLMIDDIYDLNWWLMIIDDMDDIDDMII